MWRGGSWSPPPRYDGVNRERGDTGEWREKGKGEKIEEDNREKGNREEMDKGVREKREGEKGKQSKW